jgi:hypothetical protein
LAVEASRIPAGTVGFIAGVSPGHGHSRWEPGKLFKGFLKEMSRVLRAAISGLHSIVVWVVI